MTFPKTSGKLASLKQTFSQWGIEIFQNHNEGVYCAKRGEAILRNVKLNDLHSAILTEWFEIKELPQHELADSRR